MGVDTVGDRSFRRTTIGHYEYLALLAACLLITLPLEFIFRARVYRRMRLLLLALLPVVVLFSVWDIVGIVREHWDYNPAYVTGVRLVFGMPLEELAFFVVIPICGLLTYEAVGQVLAWGRARFGRGRSDPGRSDPGPSEGGRDQRGPVERGRADA